MHHSSAKLKKEKKPRSYKLADYRNHTASLIDKMQTSNVQHSSEGDKESAESQLNFLTCMVKLMDKMLALSPIEIPAKAKVAEEMNKMPSQFFGDQEKPSIEGEKSKVFALLLIEHLENFSKMTFDSLEITTSKGAAKLFAIRSIPDQVQYVNERARQIQSDIETYEKNTKPAVK